MGWTSFFAPAGKTAKQIIIDEFSQTATSENPTEYGFTYCTQVGNTVYAVMYRQSPGHIRHYFGIVFLTSRRDGHFYYKDIETACGPYECKAPLKMVDLLDQLNPEGSGTYDLPWRAKVRDFHASKKSRVKPAPGLHVQIGKSIYELIAPAGARRGWFVRIAGRADCSTYRATAAQIARATLAV